MRTDSHQTAAAQATKAAGKLPIDLLTAPLWKALIFMALPATIGFIFNTLYNVVDLMYARGWNGPDGASPQDALGATFPLFFLQLAFAIGLYQGTTALISDAYGRGDREKARKITVQAVTYGLINGFLVTFLGLLLITPILGGFQGPFGIGIQGLSGVEFDWAAGYMIAIFVGAPLTLANFALYALLSGAGNNRAFGVSLTVAFVLNIFLNYIFMHFFGWGLVGLGVSTLLIQAPLNFLYVAWEVKRLGALKGTKLREFLPDLSILGLILKQALPSSISMLIIAVSIQIINSFAYGYADGTLGGLSVGARIEQVVLLPIIGVGIGSLAIIGQNFGAGNLARVKRMFGITTGVILTLTTLSTIALILFRQPLSNLIGTPGREADVSALYLAYAAAGAIPFGLLYVATSFKIGLRQPLFAAGANLLRLVILPLILIPIYQAYDPEFTAIGLALVTSSWIIGVSAYLWVAFGLRNLGVD